MRTYCLFLVLLLSRLNSYAQPTALGLRIGNINSGITAKHNLTEKTAIEGIAFLFTRGDGVEFAGLYEFFYPIAGAEGLSFYAGFGAHLGIWKYHHYDYYYYKNHRDYRVDNTYALVIGPNGIVGLEYKFANFPLNLSLDWFPFFNLLPEVDLFVDRVGISFRYILNGK